MRLVSLLVLVSAFTVGGLPNQVNREYEADILPEVQEYHFKFPPEVDDHDFKFPPEIDDDAFELPPNFKEHFERVYDHVNDSTPGVEDQSVESPPGVEDYTVELPPGVEDHTVESPSRVENHTVESPPGMGNNGIESPPDAENHNVGLPLGVENNTIDLPWTVDANNSELPNRNNYTGTGQCGFRAYDASVFENSRLHGSSLERRSLISKVVGGHEAARAEFPWQAKLEQDVYPEMEGRFRNPLCGAVVINEYWLLSAAHCLTGVFPVNDFRIIVGDYRFGKKDHGEQQFFLDKIIMHEQYNTKTRDYDIALIKIKRPGGGQITYSRVIQPTCLPDANTPFIDGAQCLVSGWGGNTVNSVNGVDTLRGGTVTLINQQVCVKLLDGYKSRRITRQSFCAGYLNGSTDTCAGDSGGPLVCNIAGVYTLFGITSWGRGCGVANRPGVYVRVSEFIPWILTQIKLHSSSVAEATLPFRPGAI